MDSNQVIEEQIMTRAMQEPHMATDIVGAHTMAIFGSNREMVTIANVIARYYYRDKEQLTKDALDTMLAPRLKELYRNGTIKSDKQVLGYFKDANRMLTDKIDTSDKMESLISNYVRSKIGSHQILKEVARYQSDPQRFDLVSNVVRALSKTNSLDVTGQGNHIIDVFNYKDFKKQHKAFQELNKDKVPMGIANLDKATYNGLAKGEVGLIGASSGHGKTTVLSNFSISYVKGGYNVFHVSLEELASEMLLRFARIYLGLTPDQLFTHHGTVDLKAEEYIYQHYDLDVHKKKKLGKLSFYRTSPRTLTVDGLRQIIVSAERLHHVKYDVVVLDYPDLLVDSYNTGSESLDGGMMFQDLRKMAQDLNVVLWTATQLNRTNYGQQVKTLSSIEGSYRKINTVEFAGTVNNSHKEWENGFMRIKIDKLRNRYDYQGTCLYFKYDPPTMRLRPETPSELQEHKELLNGSSNDDKMSYRKKKKSRIRTKQDRINAINRMSGRF